MDHYVFTVDTGTTNTRVILWDGERNRIGTKSMAVGVRNTAIDGHNGKLKEAVKSCLEGLLKENGLDYGQIERIIASGMITSNVGLTEVPHLAAPVTIQDLSDGITQVLLEDVCPIPIWFIPGVKNSAGPVNFENFEAMDIMRGEEVESAAIIEGYPKGKAYLLVLPGSHTKFVSVSEDGHITGCLTSITGELLSSITNDTIIADAVERKFVSEESYDRDMMLLGFETAKKSGLGRACFSARILNQFVTKDAEKLANYVLGAALQSDVTAIKNSSALTADTGTDVIVAGKNPLRQAIADLLRYDGYFNQVFEFQPHSDVPLSALGAYIIADGAARGTENP